MNLLTSPHSIGSNSKRNFGTFNAFISNMQENDNFRIQHKIKIILSLYTEQ